MRNLMIAIGMIILAGFVLDANNYYTMDGVIIEVTSDEVIVEDCRGHQWAFDGFGYKVDELVTIKFYTNGTDGERLDDVVTDVLTKEVE